MCGVCHTHTLTVLIHVMLQVWCRHGVCCHTHTLAVLTHVMLHVWCRHGVRHTHTLAVLTHMMLHVWCRHGARHTHPPAALAPQDAALGQDDACGLRHCVVDHPCEFLVSI